MICVCVRHRKLWFKAPIGTRAKSRTVQSDECIGGLLRMLCVLRAASCAAIFASAHSGYTIHVTKFQGSEQAASSLPTKYDRSARVADAVKSQNLSALLLSAGTVRLALIDLKASVVSALLVPAYSGGLAGAHQSHGVRISVQHQLCRLSI